MNVIFSHTVPDKVEPSRLYDYAIELFPTIPSRKGLKKAIDRKEVFVNGKPESTGYWIQPKDKIDLMESTIVAPKAFPLELDVVYEDEFLAVINKPGGIPVSGNQYRTIQNALVGGLKVSTENDALRWPKPVHRLDAPTKGLLLVAKTAKTLMNLGQQFEQKQIQKTYQAIVIGETPSTGEIDSPINGLASLTTFETIKVVPSLRSNHLSLVSLYPKTGRTHQLRIHLSSIGFPILGDSIYGNKGEILKGKGLYLCAVKLELTHPITGANLKVSIPTPHKFTSRLDSEERRFLRRF